MKSKIIGIVFIAVLIACMVVYVIMAKNYSNKAVDKAKEEFIFDYNEEIATIKVESLDDFYIVTIYGEENMGIYIYRDGEIYNYNNHSS